MSIDWFLYGRNISFTWVKEVKSSQFIPTKNIGEYKLSTRNRYLRGSKVFLKEERLNTSFQVKNRERLENEKSVTELQILFGAVD